MEISMNKFTKYIFFLLTTTAFSMDLPIDKELNQTIPPLDKQTIHQVLDALEIEQNNLTPEQQHRIDMAHELSQQPQQQEAPQYDGLDLPDPACYKSFLPQREKTYPTVQTTLPEPIHFIGPDEKTIDQVITLYQNQQAKYPAVCHPHTENDPLEKTLFILGLSLNELSSSQQENFRRINRVAQQLFAWQSSPLFDTKKLQNTKYIDQQLEQIGYRKVFFSTRDGIKICGLLYERDNALYNVIGVPGWMPGNKEGMSTLHEFFCHGNICLIEQQGHGESTGNLWKTTFWKQDYGFHEYKDILDTAHELRNRRPLPTVIYGACSGAFHALTAVIKAQELGELESLGKIMVIADSAWPRLEKMARQIADEHWWKKGKYIRYVITDTACSLLLTPSYRRKDTETRLDTHVSQIPSSVHVAFLHSPDDMDAPIEDAQHMAQLIPSATLDRINGAKHALLLIQQKFQTAKIIQRRIEDWLTNQ
jgi:pimeloyl-ACP methyl ester carboxylesterase